LRGTRLELTAVDAGGFQALEQAINPRRASQFDTYQRRTGFAVVALEVFKQRDVIIGTEDISQEIKQLARFLREVHQEVVLQSAMHQGTFHDFGIAQHVVVAAGDDAHDVRSRAQVDLTQAGHRQYASWFGDDAFVLVQLQKLRRYGSFGHGVPVQSAAVGIQDRVRNLADALDSCTIDEGIDSIKGYWVDRKSV